MKGLRYYFLASSLDALRFFLRSLTMALIRTSIHPKTLLSTLVGVRFTIILAKAITPNKISAQYVCINSPMVKYLGARYYSGIKQLIAVCPPITTPHAICCDLNAFA